MPLYDSVDLAHNHRFGLLAGVVIVLARNALHHGVEDPSLVEQALGLPTLVVMEGGYAVDALGGNVAAFLSGF